MGKMDSSFFVDITCPKCGRMIGNGGSGNTFRCECGYVGDGGLDKRDMERLQELCHRAAVRYREVQG